MARVRTKARALVILLVTHGHPTLATYPRGHLGRLVQPRHYSSVAETAASGMPWAADNDAYGNFDGRAYARMLDKLKGLDGCLFVTAPDVVGDPGATLDLWREWRWMLAELPAAYVAQDGQKPGAVPWSELDALFIGGSSAAWKLGPEAESLVRLARSMGKWTHLGRVNSFRRLTYAQGVGYDSADGSSWARWRGHGTERMRDRDKLARALAHLREPQLPLGASCAT
jgi:hypothetical protein